MIQKVLTATINYDHPQCGMLRAFRGIFPWVDDFDYFYRNQRGGESVVSINQAFIAACCQSKPDWIWLQLQDTNVITAESITEIRKALPKCVVTHWTGDCRPAVSPYLASICKATHLTYASSIGQLPMFLAAGAPAAKYLQIAVDWEEDLLGVPDWVPPFRVPDVVFCGNHYGDAFPGTRDRIAALGALRAASVDVGVVGNGWIPPNQAIGTCHVKQQAQVYRRAKVALAINHFNDIENYYSDRLLIAMGSGTPTVCCYVPGLEKEFEHGVECFMYRNLQELVYFVLELLGNKELRSHAGQRGRRKIWSQHTWYTRILSIVPDIEEIRAHL